METLLQPSAANTRAEAAAAGIDDSFIYDQVPLPPQERAIRMTNAPSVEARKSFEEWAASPARLIY